MSFDLSRVRFDARRDFLGVVMQQGRVQLDSDWNEWAAQLARRLQAGTLDTFGGNVVPRITPNGFKIEAAGGALSIGPGRIYVDGLLAENHGGTPDEWDPLLAELSGTTAIDFASQPYYKNPPDLPDGGPHLVYIDVWQRDVTALQDPDLIEQAVGVDTTGRLQTVWQVKVLEGVGNITCATPDDEIPGWPEVTAPSAARLSTDTADTPGEPDPCEVPPDAGYRGLENQLYRVEVHTGGLLGTATFKWSRDNATVASRVTHINPARNRITVESIGRDDVLRFNDGDWVEVTDDWLELNNLPGELRRISVAGGVDESARTLTFDTALSAGLFPVDGQQATDALRNTRVRRWDQSGQIRREDGAALENLDDAGSSGAIEIRAAGTRLFLEHGILVDFDLVPAGGAATGEFKSGDYWVFAARSTDASLELLNSAPPRGIHHHYARLAVVDFPDDESDCRTLWPPIADGDDCACTVCVTAEGHNSGSATIQQAVDSIKDSGGTVCLGIGTYNLRQAINVIGARSLRIKGQGWASMLLGSAPGGIIDIANGYGVALEDLTIIGSAAQSGGTSMISARNVVDFRADHINVLGLAVGDSTSIAIGLTGYVLGASISDCGLVAERGIAAVGGGDRNYLLAAELRVSRNLFFCSQRAVSFEDLSLHYGNTRIADNLMLVGNQAAVVTSGAVLDGSVMSIADNVIYTGGDGIRAGVDGLAIERNEVYGIGARSGDGILLLEGLDPQAVNNACIADNRLMSMGGNAIAITHRVENARISGNRIDRIGLGALVMNEGASANYLDFSNNQCHDLGLAIDNSNVALAALQLIRVEQGDVRDNLVAMVALQAVASPAIDGLRAAAVGQLRIAGNRFYGIGPDRISAPVSALHLLPPFDRVAIDDNSIERIGSQDQKPTPIEWRAINILPDRTGATRYAAAASYFDTGEVAYMLTTTRAIAFPRLTAAVSIRGNQLRGQSSMVPLNQCGLVDDCLFTENRCEVFGRVEKEPIIGEISARTITVTNNRLIAPNDLLTLHLHPQIERAIVMGNTSTGGIAVNGAAVPDPIDLTNIFGT
jgi:hypothetical protein